MVEFDAGLHFRIDTPTWSSDNGGGGYNSNPIGDLFSLAGTTTSGAFDLAGQTINGTFDLANQTLNNSFALLSGAGNNGNFGLSREQGGNGAGGGSLGEGLGNLFTGLGNMTNNLGEAAGRLSDVCYEIADRQLYYESRYNALYGNNWWYGSSTLYGPTFWSSGMASWLNAPLNAPLMGPLPFSYGPMTYSPWGQQPITLKPLNELMFPSKKGSDSGKTDGDKPERERSEVTDSNGLPTPTWYQSLAQKEKDKKPLTNQEKALLDAQDKLLQEYKPYQLDDDKNVKIGPNEKPMLSPLGNEIISLAALIKSGSMNAIANKISLYPPEKLAAIEAWFSEVTKTQLGEEMSLRATIKESSLTFCGISFNWTGYNRDKTLEIFDKLDEAAMTNPQNMAASLQQAINNHRIGGTGIDEDRVIKLLKMAEKNPAFLAAVKDHYGLLEADISDKWFMSSEGKRIAFEILNKVPQ